MSQLVSIINRVVLLHRKQSCVLQIFLDITTTPTAVSSQSSLPSIKRFFFFLAQLLAELAYLVMLLTVQWHKPLAVCISWSINNIAKLANSRNTDVRMTEFSSPDGGDSGEHTHVVWWRCPMYLQCKTQFCSQQNYLTELICVGHSMVLLYYPVLEIMLIVWNNKTCEHLMSGWLCLCHVISWTMFVISTYST